ncbi:MAG TPA: hypothetical protein VK689_07630, partial [Armatimonadota bacterium]|nr:hypothetical protein [Armatimonadota bacterium]
MPKADREAARTLDKSLWHLLDTLVERVPVSFRLSLSGLEVRHHSVPGWTVLQLPQTVPLLLLIRWETPAGPVERECELAMEGRLYLPGVTAPFSISTLTGAEFRFDSPSQVPLRRELAPIVGNAATSPLDALILTAADGEPEGVLAVSEGRLREWREERGLPPTWIGKVWRAEFRTPSGKPLRVVLARTQDQGPQAAANTCGVLIPHYRPQCVAMAGVCAGRPGKTQLGDVVLAERLYRYDGGGQVAGKDGGSYTEHDVITYRLGPDWLDAARELQKTLEHAVGSDEEPDWVAGRPPSLEWQQWWVLDTLDRGENPLQHPDVGQLLPGRNSLVKELSERGWITRAPISLTETGRQALKDERNLRGEELLQQPPWSLHVAPMGIGEKLIRDPKAWELLGHLQRHTLALEMEGAAVGYSGWAQDVRRCLVVKGIMDNGDPGKTDTYRLYAARAAGEVLLRFLRENLQPQGRGPEELLHTGTAPLPPDPLPSHFLTARYQVVRFLEALPGPVWQGLLDWTTEVGAVGVRLFTGPGGVGKTRLFQELAARLREADAWDAGFLLEAEDESAIDTLTRNGRPTLVIVDYAETHRHRDRVLQAALKEGQSGRVPLRIALLARDAGDWWAILRSGTDWQGLLDAPPRELPEV